MRRSYSVILSIIHKCWSLTGRQLLQSQLSRFLSRYKTGPSSDTIKCSHFQESDLFLPRDAMHKRGLRRRTVYICLISICRLSVTFVYSLEANKYIFNFFSPSGSQTILVFFQDQMLWQYFDAPAPNGGVECS